MGLPVPARDSLLGRQTSKQETTTLPGETWEHKCCDEWWGWRGKAQRMLPEGNDTQAKTQAGKAGERVYAKNLEARKLGPHLAPIL